MIWASLLDQIKSERRECPRIRTSNLMKETSAVPVLKHSTCNLINLSEKGFQFNNPHWVTPQHEMDVMINLPEKGRHIEATVKIIWCRVIQRNHVYCRVGVSFVAIKNDDLAAIRSLIKRRLGRSENRITVRVDYLANRIAPNYFNPRFN